MSESSSLSGSSRIQSLIDAAERLVERRRHEPLTLAEIAREAGMSEDTARSVVPDERAMVDALAEMAMKHLLDAVSRRTTTADLADPNARVTAIAEGFLDWAIQRPTELLMMSDRNIMDLGGTAPLQRLNSSIRDLLTRSLAEARDQGRLSADYDLDMLALTGRALVYGLARMVSDGHLEEWKIDTAADPHEIAMRSLRTYLMAMYNR